MMENCGLYVMKGKIAKNRLERYHLIVAPSYVCNLKCQHCYLPNHSHLLLKKEKLLEIIDEWAAIVREETSQKGIFHLKGGEPFVFSYLWEILEYLASKNNLEVYITTNGTLTDKLIFDRLRTIFSDKNNDLTFIVSLDGFMPETNALLRGKTHYYKAKSFIKNLMEYKFKFQINYVVHRYNFHEMEKFVKWAIKEGSSQVNFIKFIAKGYGSKIKNFEINKSLYNQTITDLYKNGNDHVKRILTGSIPYIQQKEDGRIASKCVGGYRGFMYITPNGNVYSCPATVFKETLIGNVYHETLTGLLEKTEEIRETLLKKYFKPFSCVGELILKHKSSESINELSNPENDYNKFSKYAYCFNRNW